MKEVVLNPQRKANSIYLPAPLFGLKGSLADRPVRSTSLIIIPSDTDGLDR